MITKKETQLFMRYMKEKNIYYKYKYLWYKCKDKKHDIFSIFDDFITWGKTKEGYQFWYYIQLDFVKLLLIYNYKNINYLRYYKELLANYRSYHYKHDDLFQNHLAFLKKCQDILSVDTWPLC